MSATPPPGSTPADSHRTWIGLLIGIACGLLGLLPWLSRGERLPIQNLWQDATLPDDYPWAFLPLSQYLFTTTVALLALGGLFAGLVARWAKPHLTLPAVRLGMLVVHIVAIAESMLVLVPRLRPTALAVAYDISLLLACLTGLALAQLTLAVVARGRIWQATIAVSLNAALVAPWASAWMPSLVQATMPTAFWITLMFAPGVVLGAALAWCGLSSRSAVSAWAVSLITLWLSLGAIQGLGFAAARNTIKAGPAEIVTAFVISMSTVLIGHSGALQVVALAAVTGLIGLGVRFAVRTSTQPPQR